MCNRFTLRATQEEIALKLRLQQLPIWTPRFNIAPSQSVLGVRINNRQQASVLLKWPLLPFWSKTPQIKFATMNARADTIAEKPAYRASFKKRRCLIVADGFYEWPAQSPKGTPPFFFTLKDQQLFAFAGIWDHWQQGNHPAIESCSIVTTTPNEWLSDIHHRMPVILPEEDYDAWLNPDENDTTFLQSLLKPYPETEMQRLRVSNYVNSVRNEGPECLKPEPD